MLFDPNSIPWYIWFISGGVISVGILIALHDNVSKKITTRDNLGWFLVVAGVILLGGWFLFPFLPILWGAIVQVWEGATTTMLVALAISVLLIVLGAIFIRRHSRHPNP